MNGINDEYESEKKMFQATTIVGIRHNGQVAIAGDGQMTFGQNVIMKNNVKKVRRIYNDKILVGFAGSASDSLELCERFEHKAEKYNGNLRRSAVELAKDWRSNKVLKKLDALLIIMNEIETFIISGTGEVFEPDDDIATIGSGGPYAQAAALALKKHSHLSAEEMVLEAMKITADICVYTNHNITVEVL